MWQTETGGPIFGNPYGLGPAADQARLGRAAAARHRRGRRRPDGEPVPAGEKGIMVIRRPFPGLTATLWGEPERYGADYWERIPGVYYAGDAAHIDEDGYVWFAGRADEIIKIAAHRLGTIEVETAFLRHPAVAEAGVTGGPDELRGEVIAAFVVLKAGHEPSDELRRELLATVREELGPVAVIGVLVRGDAAQDAQRQDHAPRAQGGRAGPRPGRHHHDRGRGLGRGGAPRGRGAAGGDPLGHRVAAAGHPSLRGRTVELGVRSSRASEPATIDEERPRRDDCDDGT